jgi:nicotinamidase/pyrazinamidase
LKDKRALVVVDLQRDFCPGGALAVKNGDEVVRPINSLVDGFEAAGQPVIFTRDWHPKDHCSFKPQGGTWPPHAVRDTPGAGFQPTLHVPQGATVISKGTERDSEAYSGFEGTGLSKRLKRMKVKDLYVSGLATDYCVKNTAMDAIREGFRVFIVTDCVKGVNLKRTASATAFRTMVGAGVRTTTSHRLLRSLGGRVAVSSSS